MCDYRIRAYRSPGFYFPFRVFGWASNQIYHTWASNQAGALLIRRRYQKCFFFKILHKIIVIWHTYAMNNSLQTSILICRHLDTSKNRYSL